MYSSLVMSTEVVESKTFHTDLNIHSAALPMPSASQSKGAVTKLAAASPATSQTLETTGTSHTSTIVLLLLDSSSSQTAWPTFQKKLTNATEAPVTIAAPRAMTTPNFPRPARWGLDEFAPIAHTTAEMISAKTARIRPTVMDAP